MIRRGWTIFIALILTALLAVPAAAAEVPDYSRTGSISVTIRDQDERPVKDGSLELIFVAKALWDGTANRFEYTAEFAGCTEKLDDGGVTRNGSPRLAAALKDFAEKNGISGMVCPIDAEGTVRFSDLTLGLYLIMQKDTAEGYTAIEPFLVSLPYEEDGKLLYDIDAAPKPGTVTKTTEPEGTTEPEETTGSEETTKPEEPTEPETLPDLPQTGQLWWPVPVLASIGAVLVLLGVLVRRSKKEEK